MGLSFGAECMADSLTATAPCRLSLYLRGRCAHSVHLRPPCLLARCGPADEAQVECTDLSAPGRHVRVLGVIGSVCGDPQKAVGGALPGALSPEGG